MRRHATSLRATAFCVALATIAGTFPDNTVPLATLATLPPVKLPGLTPIHLTEPALLATFTDRTAGFTTGGAIAKPITTEAERFLIHTGRAIKPKRQPVRLYPADLTDGETVTVSHRAVAALAESPHYTDAHDDALASYLTAGGFLA